MLPSCVLSDAPNRSFWQWRVVQLWPGDIFNCVSCFLVKKHATFKWKEPISEFPVSPGSAEALVRWGGKIKYILIVYFLGNICAKKLLQSNSVCKDYSKSKVGRFLRHSVLQCCAVKNGCDNVMQGKSHELCSRTRDEWRHCTSCWWKGLVFEALKCTVLWQYCKAVHDIKADSVTQL